MAEQDYLSNFDSGWQMKDVDTAITDISKIDGNRLEIGIHHELLKGVTPRMIVWWFRNFPEDPGKEGSGCMKYRDKIIPCFRFWHPYDHIYCNIRKSGKDESAGFSKGAELEIKEKLGDNDFGAKIFVDRLDESGFEITAYNGFLKIAEFKHYFIETLNGTICESSAVIGSYKPVIGRAVTSFIRRRYFTDEMSQAWVKHTIEEVGNLENFLPALFELGFENAFV